MFFGANLPVCQGRSTPYIGGGHPTRNRESLWSYGYINPHTVGLMTIPFYEAKFGLSTSSDVGLVPGMLAFTMALRGYTWPPPWHSAQHALSPPPRRDPQATHTICLPAIGKCWALAEVDRMVIANTPWRLLTRRQPGEHFTFGDAKLWKKAWPSLWVSKRLKRSFGGATHIRLKPMHFLILHSITTLVWVHSRCQTPSLLHQDTLPTTAWLVPQILWAHRLSSSRRCLGRARMKKRTKNFRKLWIQWYQRWLARTCTWLRRSTFFANCTHRCAWPYHLRSHARERVPFPATYALGAFALLSPEPTPLKKTRWWCSTRWAQVFFQMWGGEKNQRPYFQHILMGGGIRE